MKIIGLDLGSKTLGVAVSDYLEIMALPVNTFHIQENNLEDALEIVKNLSKEYDSKKIVLGLPKNMDGSIGFQAEYCLKFKDMICDELGLEVKMIDERLSSKIAHQSMNKADFSKKNKKKSVDKIAACVILQSYLDSTIR